MREAPTVLISGQKGEGEEFERDDSIELGIQGLIDHSHPTLADLLKNLIMRYRLVDHVNCNSSYLVK
jgi:hypothetical protein